MAWLSEAQAATALGVSHRTIRRRVGNGSLRVMRQGRRILVDVDPHRLPDSRPGTTDLEADENRPPASAIIVQPTAPEATNAVPVAPVPVASTTTNLMTSPTASPVAGNTPRFRPNGQVARWETGWERWTTIGLWLAATLLLSGGTAAAWFHYHARLGIRDAEARYAQSVAGAQQTQAEHERQLVGQAQIAAERQDKLTSELVAVRKQLDETTRALDKQGREAASLRAELAAVSSHFAEASAEQAATSRKLLAAQTNIAVLRGEATLSNMLEDWLNRLATRPLHSPTALPTNLPGPQPSDDAAESRPRNRLIPRQPPRLGDEDTVSLRPLMRRGQP
ncbi:MAG: hypothetical protein HY718_16770 [Planctomycetes bacterium]|nr:hypothetical protein [Planctomycetota bacterium]